LNKKRFDKLAVLFKRNEYILQ